MINKNSDAGTYLETYLQLETHFLAFWTDYNDLDSLKNTKTVDAL